MPRLHRQADHCGGNKGIQQQECAAKTDAKPLKIPLHRRVIGTSPQYLRCGRLNGLVMR
jgi:hypothetical protein